MFIFTLYMTNSQQDILHLFNFSIVCMLFLHIFLSLCDIDMSYFYDALSNRVPTVVELCVSF